MNLLQIKRAFGGGVFFAVSYASKVSLHAEFADREATDIDKLPPGHYLVIQLPVPPMPESGVFAVPEPKAEARHDSPRHRGQGIGGNPQPVPPTPERKPT